MAAGFLKHATENKVKVFSAGSKPGKELNPMAVEAMAEIGIDIAQNTPMTVSYTHLTLPTILRV